MQRAAVRVGPPSLPPSARRASRWHDWNCICQGRPSAAHQVGDHVSAVVPTLVAMGACFHRRLSRRSNLVITARRAAEGRQPDDVGLGSEEPNDMQLDQDFTLQFDEFVEAYKSPLGRLRRWWRRAFGPRLLQKTSRSDYPSTATSTKGTGEMSLRGPPPAECLLAAVAYLLPLAGGPRCASPLFAIYPDIARMCAPLVLLTAPFSSPLGVALACIWLCFGITDRRVMHSYFVRYNFFQALLLSGLFGVAAVLRQLLSAVLDRLSCAVHAPGLVDWLQVVIWGTVLCVAFASWAWSAARCLQGRYPDNIPVVSGVTNRQVRW